MLITYFFFHLPLHLSPPCFLLHNQGWSLTLNLTPSPARVHELQACTIMPNCISLVCLCCHVGGAGRRGGVVHMCVHPVTVRGLTAYSPFCLLFKTSLLIGPEAYRMQGKLSVGSRDPPD